MNKEKQFQNHKHQIFSHRKRIEKLSMRKKIIKSNIKITEKNGSSKKKLMGIQIRIKEKVNKKKQLQN